MSALLLLVEDLELHVSPDKSIIEVFYNDRLSALAPHRYIPQKLGVSLFSEGGSVLVMKVTGWKPRSICEGTSSFAPANTSGRRPTLLCRQHTRTLGDARSLI